MTCHPRATCHVGVRIPSAILKIVFRRILFFFLTAVWALTSGGFHIVSDTLVSTVVFDQKDCYVMLIATC